MQSQVLVWDEVNRPFPKWMMVYLEYLIFTLVRDWNFTDLKLKLGPFSNEMSLSCRLADSSVSDAHSHAPQRSEKLLRLNEPLPARHHLKALKIQLQSALDTLTFIMTSMISKSSHDLKKGLHSSKLRGGLGFLLPPSRTFFVSWACLLWGWYSMINLWASGSPEGPAICGTEGGCTRQTITSTIWLRGVAIEIKHTRCLHPSLQLQVPLVQRWQRHQIGPGVHQERWEAVLKTWSIRCQI